MTRQADHYTILGVSVDASAGEIEDAFARKMAELEESPLAPDIRASRREILRRAVMVLGDAARRRSYDQLFLNRRPPRGQAQRGAYLTPDHGDRGRKERRREWQALLGTDEDASVRDVQAAYSEISAGLKGLSSSGIDVARRMNELGAARDGLIAEKAGGQIGVLPGVKFFVTAALFALGVAATWFWEIDRILLHSPGAVSANLFALSLRIDHLSPVAVCGTMFVLGLLFWFIMAFLVKSVVFLVDLYFASSRWREEGLVTWSRFLFALLYGTTFFFLFVILMTEKLDNLRYYSYFSITFIVAVATSRGKWSGVSSIVAQCTVIPAGHFLYFSLLASLLLEPISLPEYLIGEYFSFGFLSWGLLFQLGFWANNLGKNDFADVAEKIRSRLLS